jgi:hypothetical protein
MLNSLKAETKINDVGLVSNGITFPTNVNKSRPIYTKGCPASGENTCTEFISLSNSLLFVYA